MKGLQENLNERNLYNSSIPTMIIDRLLADLDQFSNGRLFLMCDLKSLIMVFLRYFLLNSSVVKIFSLQNSTLSLS